MEKDNPHHGHPMRTLQDMRVYVSAFKSDAHEDFSPHNPQPT